MSDLTHQRLLEVLDYDPETGVWRWRVDRGSMKAGDIAGSDHCAGYIEIGVFGKTYLAHRLAYFYVHGEWPASEIDHHNLDKKDNAFSNLRPAVPFQNRGNTRCMKNNKSGIKGVHWSPERKKWCAFIQVHRQTINLGRYDSSDKAAAAYAVAARKYFGDFARAS